MRQHSPAETRPPASPVVHQGADDGDPGLDQRRHISQLGATAHLARAVQDRADGAAAHPLPRMRALAWGREASSGSPDGEEQRWIRDATRPGHE
ncbi:hypothetical protein NPX13_g9436 [Xylaria arbuscula]|uniref:Uncharacterized protein n=1 Tax=Xylaria arbuscula TaxID=114810 RepID=A0A9W8N6K8_9PEZI|nr:hypothetical protein NPX13_g9436 [Xylaria arbuscula]